MRHGLSRRRSMPELDDQADSDRATRHNPRYLWTLRSEWQLRCSIVVIENAGTIRRTITMPRTNINTRRRQTNARRKTNRPRRIKRHAAMAHNATARQLYTSRNGSSSLRSAASEGARGDIVGAAGIITGSVLALGSMLIAAPIIFVVEAFQPGRARGGGLSTQSEQSDLRARKYRDESGQIHHHTRSYMQDHADEVHSVAA